MSTRKKIYLICYDIRDQKRWRKCYKLLKSYGHPIQYSVFQCYVGEVQIASLRWELSVVLSDEDSLLIAPIQKADVNRIVQLNLRSIIEERTDRFRLF